MPLRSSGLRVQTSINAPCSLRPQGEPVFLFLASPKGACRTLRQKAASAAAREPGEHPARRLKVNDTRAVAQLNERGRCTEPGPRKQPFACVPHTDGFVGLLDVPGMAVSASVPPFVRAVARTCTRAVRPLHRRLPRPLWKERTFPRAPLPGIVADLRAPFHAAKTIAARSVSVRDRKTSIPS
jgi:hypothetical protein